MKLVGYDADGVTMIGGVDAAGDVRALGEIQQFWRAQNTTSDGPVAGNIKSLRQRPAVPPTARVICVGLNYRLHAQEANQPIPQVPVIFARWAQTLTVDGAPAPAIEEKFDWEGELGVVIGRRMFRVDEEQAAKGVFGYAAFNDLSARSFQMQTPQWILGKNSDASGPMSAVVTADEVGDPAKGLRITTRVNGETMQDSTTADMIFSVPKLIAHLSQVMTLTPGDFIVTGTPSGVGMALGKFLKPGDTVEVEIENIGVVRTPIVAPPASIA